MHASCDGLVEAIVAAGRRAGAVRRDTGADEGIETALAHLRAAVEAAGPDEALRAGRAAALLRRAQGPRDEHGLLPSVLQ